MQPFGLVVVHKPLGVTSRKTVDMLKKRLLQQHGLRKFRIGHGGSLDKDASGVLIIGYGKGTKLLGDFVSAPKTYNIRIMFDHVSHEQQYIHNGVHSQITESQLAQVLQSMVGSFEYMAESKTKKDVVLPPKKKTCKISSVKYLGYSWPNLDLQITFEGSANLQWVTTTLLQALGIVNGILFRVHRASHGDCVLGTLEEGGMRHL
jgi:hypothetical protein